MSTQTKRKPTLEELKADLDRRRAKHELEKQQRALEAQIRREKYAPIIERAKAGSKAVGQFITSTKPYAKEAYTELKPAVKTAAKGAWHGFTSYVGRVAGSTPPSTTFLLTNKGRGVIETYYKGDYSIIPQGSMRAQLLHLARTSGSFSIGGAISMYGDNGVMAAQMLAESGLVERR